MSIIYCVMSLRGKREKTLVKNLQKILFFGVIFILYFILKPAFSQAVAGVPKILNYQGRLLNSSGDLLGGASGTNYCFKFSFYTTSTVGSGSKVWPSSVPATSTVSVKSGVFNFGIGDTAAGSDLLDFNFQDNDDVYLNVEVASQVSGACGASVSFETLSPRQRITAAGFAINASTVGGFTASESASGNQIPVLSSGNLNLGGTNPQLNATTTNTLTLQGGGGTGDIQFFSSANKLTSGGSLTLAGALTTGGLTFTNASGTMVTSTNVFATSVSSTNLYVASLFSFGNAAGTSVTSTNLAVTTLNILATSTFRTTTIAGGFFQTDFTDCSGETQTVNYNATTGKFTCLSDEGGGGSSGGVNTSTANYFAFYMNSTAVTGTPLMQFSNGAITFTTNTVLANTTIASATTTNLYVSGALNLPSNSITDAMVVDTITASNYLLLTGGTLSGAFGFTTATGTSVTSTNGFFTTLAATNLNPINISATSVTSTNLNISGTLSLPSNSVTDAMVVDTITASNYLLLTGGSLSGPLGFTSASGTMVTSTNLLATNATTTNLYVSGALLLPNNSITDAMVVDTITASNYLLLTGGTLSGAFGFTTATGTSVTSTNGFFTNLAATNFLPANINTTNVTSTNLYISGVTNLGDTTITTLAATSVTTTNLNVSGVLSLPNNSVTDAMVVDTITASNYLTLAASTSLPYLGLSYPALATSTFVQIAATTSFPNLTNIGTITNLAFTNANGTSVTTTNLNVSGVLSLPNNSVTDAMVVDSITASNYLLLTGGTLSGAFGFTTATGTSVTSTNAFFTNLAATNFNPTNLTATSITTTNFNASGSISLPSNSITDAMVVDTITASNYLLLTGGTLSGAFGFTTATGTSVTSTNGSFETLAATSLNISASSTFRTTTIAGGFFQTGFADCSGDTQTVNYNATTGKFTCLVDDTTGGSSGSGVNTSTSNYFTFYLNSTAVTGTPLMQFSNGAIAFTTNTTFTDSTFTSATTTNLNVSGALSLPSNSVTDAMVVDTITASNYLLLTGGTLSGAFGFTTATGTSVTSTNGFFTNLAATNFSPANINTTNVTSTNLYISGITNLGDTTITTFAATSVTTTNLNVTGALSLPANSVTDAMVVDTITASNYLLLTGGSLSGPLGFTSASGTMVTSTNLLATNATTTNLYVSGALLLPNNSVTDAMVVDTITASNYLLLTGGTLSGAFGFTTATGTSVTSTNGFFTTLAATNFSPANINTTNVTSTNLNVSGLTVLGNTTITNVTSTNLNISGTTNLAGTTVTTLNFTSATGTNFNISGTTNLAGTTITNLSATSVTTTNLNVTGALSLPSNSVTDAMVADTITASNYLLLTGGTLSGAFGFTTATGTSVTSTNGFFTNLAATNFSPANINTTNVTSTNLYISGITNLGDTAITTLAATSVTTTNLNVSGALSLPNNSVTDAMVADTITASNYLLLTGGTLSGAFGFTTATGTSVTSTNGFFTTLAATNLNPINISATSITSTNLNISGTLSLPSNSVTDAMVVDTITASNYLLLTGGTLSGAFGFTTATGTSVTSTNGFFTTLAFTNATGTNAAITRLNPAAGDAGALTIGAPQGTGAITVGNSSANQTLSLGIGTSSTVNIATGPGSTTIFIGTNSAALGGVHIGSTGVTTTIDGGLTVVGIGVTSTNIYSSGITNLAGTTVTTLAATSVTTTNLYVSGALALPNNSVTDAMVADAITASNYLLLTGGTLSGAFGFTTATGTSVTSTNGFFTNLAATNFSPANINTTNVSTTNIYVSGLTNLGNTTITNVTSTNLNISGTTNLAGTTITNLSATSVTTTNLNVSGALSLPSNSVTDAMVVDTITASNYLLLTGGTLSGAFGFTTATGTSVTSTNAFFTTLAATNFSPANINTTNVTSTNLYISGITNLGDTTITTLAATSVTTTNLNVSGALALPNNSITDAMVVDTITASNYLLLTGGTLSGAFGFITATGTSVTSTNGFFTTLAATNLNPTNISATSITSTNLNISGTLSLPSNSVTDAMVVDTITASNYLLLTGGSLSGPLGFTSASGTMVTSTNFLATNATTTNLYVSGALNLPSNSVTDAMVVDTITASNYLTLAASTSLPYLGLSYPALATSTFVQIAATTSFPNLTNIGTITNLAFTNANGTSVTTTNLNVSGVLSLPSNSVTDAMVVDTITAANYLLLTGGTLSGAFGFTTATGTSVTSTNAFFTTLAATNFSPANINTTNVTSTNLAVSGLTSLGNTTISSATSTNLNVSGVTNLGGTTITALNFTSATGTNLNISSVTNLAGTTITNLSATSATTTNLYVSGALSLPNNSVTDAMVADTITASNYLLLTGGTLSGAFGFTTATGTSVTSTNGFFTNLAATNFNPSSINTTNVSSTNATSTNLYIFGTVLLPTNSITDAMVVDGLTISGGTIDNTPIGNGTASTGIFSQATSTRFIATSVTSTNLYVSGALNLPSNSVTDAMVVDTITASNYLLLTGGTLSGAFGFTTATGTSVTSTNAFFTTLSGTTLNIAASSTFRTSTIAGGFFQTDLGDCDLDTQTVNYDLTTGKFSCLADAAGGAGTSAFTTAITVTNGAGGTTSSLRADGLFIATSTANLNGLLFVNNTGSVSASGSLAVFSTSTFIGNVSNIIAASTNLTVVATTTVGTTPTGMFISGRYAYVPNYGSGDVSIVDVSSPSNPVQVGLAAVGTQPTSVYVSGRYAYVANFGGASVSVVDISNPAAPKEVSTLTVDINPFNIYVSGHYAYVVSHASDLLTVIDISNPLAPIQVGTAAAGLDPTSVYVSGRYAYVADSSDNVVVVIDVSSPSAPRQITTVTADTNPYSIYVSGRYAYSANYTAGSLSVIDISNPESPDLLANVAVGTHPASIYVSGRYAYVANYDSANISVVDVSSSTAPVVVKTISVDVKPSAIYVSGRYAYITNETAGTISVIDISGTEVTSLIAHSAEVGNLQSRNDIFAQGNIIAGTGLMVGNGGIMSQGGLSVFVSSTGSTSSIFRVGSSLAAATSSLQIFGNGTITLATTTISSSTITTLNVTTCNGCGGGVSLSANNTWTGTNTFATTTMTSSTILNLNATNVTSSQLSVTNILSLAGLTGTITIGAPAGTGLITVGNSTVAQTLSLGIGTSSTINLGTGVGTTTISIGTGGAAGGVQIGGTNVSTTIMGGLSIVGIGATSTNLYVSGATNLGGTTISSSTISNLNATNVTSTQLSVTNILSAAGVTGAIIIGAPVGTGLITVGNSTVAQTLSLGIGTSSTINLGTGVGTTTIKIGTGGAAGGVQIGGTNVSTTIMGGLSIVGIGATTTNLYVSGVTNLGTLNFTSATGTNFKATSLNISASSTFQTSTIAGGFFQTDFTDCSNDTQTVNYNATTGKFTCLTDSGGGAPSSIFSTPITVTDGVTTSSLRADGLFIATSTTNLSGLFSVNSVGNISASGSLSIFGVINVSNTLAFINPTSTITMPTSSILNINRSGAATNTLFSVRDMNVNFGSAVTAGAFMDKNSYFGEEFNNFRRGNCSGATASSSQSRGDFGNFAATACATQQGEFSLATSTLTPYPGLVGTRASAGVNVLSLRNAANGIERISIISAATNSSTAEMEYLGTTANTGNFLWATTTLPVFTAKVRPSTASSTTSTVKYWVGFFGGVSSSVAMMAPTSSPDGVYFTNCIGAGSFPSIGGNSGCNQESWIGMIKSGTNIATTSCAVADTAKISTTTGFNYLRFEFVNSNSVRFLVDSNTANGVSEVDCGTITVTSALYPNLTSLTAFAALYVDNPNITASLDIDYFRIWQDDNDGGSSYLEQPLQPVSTTLDLFSLSSLGEMYPSLGGGGEFPEGSIIALDKFGQNGQVTSSQSAYDSSILGVTVVNTGLSLNNNTVENGVQVATHGRALVRVTTANGPIQPGDFIAASAIPGVGMKASLAGQVLGQAVTAFYNEGEGTVVVSINPQYYNGGGIANVKFDRTQSSQQILDGLLTNLSSVSGAASLDLSSSTSSTTTPTTTTTLSQLFVDKMFAGMEIIAPEISTNNLSLNSIKPISGNDIHFVLSSSGKVLIGEVGTSSSISFDSKGNGIFAGEITASKINGLIPGLADLQSIVSTTMNQVGFLESLVQTIGSQLASTQEQLLVMLASPTTTTSMALDFNMLTQSNGLQFEHFVSFKEGLQTDSIGSISGTTTLMSDIIFFGRPYLNSDSGGFAVVASGTKEVAVTFDNEYLDKPVIQVTMSFVSTTEDATTTAQESDIFSADVRYIVSRATPKGFVIVLNKVAPFDVRFDWLALAIKNPKLFGIVTSSPAAVSSPGMLPTTLPSADTPFVVDSSATPTTMVYDLETLTTTILLDQGSLSADILTEEPSSTSSQPESSSGVNVPSATPSDSGN